MIVGLLVMWTATGRAAEPLESISLSPVQVESRQRIATDLEYLSSDELAGRDTGSAEIDVAAAYIADRFESLGLNTQLYAGTPYQSFSASTETTPGAAEENALTLDFADGRREQFALDEALRPLALGTSGQASGPLVFAGYGISAPEKGYDDYAGLDVTGCIVVVLRGEPRRGRSDNPFSPQGPSRYAYFTTKVETAIAKGAAGLLIANHPDAAAEQVEQVQSRLRAQQQQLTQIDQSLAALPAEAVNSRTRLAETRGVVVAQVTALEAELQRAPEALLGTSEAGQRSGEEKLLVASLGRRSLADLVAASTVDGPARQLEEIESRIDASLQPRSFVFAGVTATLKTALEVRDIEAKNVIAELPGRGPLADQTVVIGAHYDHVGMGGAGSLAPGTVAIHNGADDNGSGTATLLEVAHRLSQQAPESRRRIVFMAFTAEEKGLLGSKHYVREPRFPLEETVGMINLDMVGRLNETDGLTIFGVGTAPGFDAVIDRWNAEAQLPVVKDESGYGPSDHTSFYEHGIPVLFFFTGLHPDYHRPSDDFDKINLDGMVRITDMVTQAADYLATTPERPVFQKTGPGQGVARARRSQVGFLGIQMQQADGGVVITDVVDASPAADAGLRSGDTIVRIDEQASDAVEVVQRAIGEKRPGDVVSLSVRRANGEITVAVPLGRRP